MTVIAWDGKILAADKLATCNGTIRTCTKIIPHPAETNNTLFAHFGTEVAGLIMVDWHINGGDVNAFPKSQDSDSWSGLVVVSPGSVMEYGRWPKPVVHDQDRFYAWGSGRDAALGAMAAGANAVEAARIACRYDDGCGRGVDWFRLSGGKHGTELFDA